MLKFQETFEMQKAEIFRRLLLQEPESLQKKLVQSNKINLFFEGNVIK